MQSWTAGSETRPLTAAEIREQYEAARADTARLAREHLAACQAQAGQARLEKELGRAGVPPRFQSRTFETFDAASDGQRRAERICRAYAERFAELRADGKNLLLLGRPRTGKTHLACAILQAVIAQHYTGLFTRCADVVMDFRDSYKRDEAEGDVLARYTHIDLLVLDEAGISTGGEDHRQDRLFQVLNHRCEHLRPTILMGNVTTAELQDWLGERSYLRLVEAGAPVVPFEWSPYQPEGTA